MKSEFGSMPEAEAMRLPPELPKNPFNVKKAAAQIEAIIGNRVTGEKPSERIEQVHDSARALVEYLSSLSLTQREAVLKEVKMRTEDDRIIEALMAAENLMLPDEKFN
jgi:hypothetical protein